MINLCVVVIKMSKTKLTLYIDKKVRDKAKKISRITGKSIPNFKISEKVSHWVGIAESDKDYKELRDEVIYEKTKKYED